MPSHAPPCFTDGVVCFGSWAVPSLLHTFFLSLWYRLILIAAIQRILCHKWSGFLDVFGLIWPCLHLVVNPLYLLSWSLLLNVDFDSVTATSRKVSSLGWYCERVFLSHGEDSPIIHHCCPPWTSRPFYVAELSSVFFFSECTKLMIWPLLKFLLSQMDLVCFWSLTIICFTLYGSFDCMMWVHSNSFQMQMAYLESTPDLKPA